MIKEGILKGANRKEGSWKATKLGEPFKKELDQFRKDVLGRDDFDPTSLLQFGLFMSMAVINMLKENEATFGIEGQRAANRALIKTGYDVGKQIIEKAEVPSDISPIELMSFLCTIVNTQAWTSIEDPRVDAEDKCSFDILWCPLQDVYKAFDCRVQRYLVQGIIDAFKEFSLTGKEYQVEFTKTIPAGGECCSFVLSEKKPGEPDMWEDYSKLLEKRALKRQRNK